jgi:Domain of unknown function (DUF4157)
MHELEADSPPIGAARTRGRGPRPSSAESASGVTSEHAAVLRLQRTAGNAAVAQLLGDRGHQEEEPSPVLDVIGSGGGQPLEPATRSLMEAHMGHSFGDVRVHTDTRATESARAVNAQAYTVGTNVVVQSDRYRPGTPEGDRLLAHELTHVVQQAAGPVSGTPAAGGIQLSDPSDSFEQAAERNADLVMSSAGALNASVLPSAAPSAVQREVGEEEPEEEVQTLVQRQTVPEEEPEPEEGAAP